MKGIREIKGRIKSVKNTAQITKAMQLVAASKMKKAQDAALAARPYALMLAEMLAALPERLDEGLLAKHPLLTPRGNVQRRGIILLTSDKGLCGALNSNLFRLLMEKEAKLKENNPNLEFVYIAAGRKGAQFLARTGRNMVAEFTIDDARPFQDVRPLVDYALKAYQGGEIDTIDVLYPAFENTLTQHASFASLVPVSNFVKALGRLRQRYGMPENDVSDSREMNFEPSPQAILNILPEMYVKYEIFERVLEAKASEQSARMVAMKSATDNAQNLKDDLTLEYNKARQAAITQEILELSAAVATSS